MALHDWWKTVKGLDLGGTGIGVRTAGAATTTPTQTPAPTPSPQAAPTIYAGGSSPDYRSLIQGDPSYLAWQGSRDQRLRDLSTQRAAALKALTLRYGFSGENLPQGFKDFYGDLSPADLEVARANPYSEEALLGRNYTQGVEDYKRQLAARGALQSGELGYGLDQADFSRGVSEYNLGQDYLGQVQQALNSYAQGSGDVYAEEPGIIGQAQQNVYQAYRPAEARPATLIQGSAEQFGFPIYQSDDGSTWRIDPGTGQPVVWDSTFPGLPDVTPTPALPGQDKPPSQAKSIWDAMKALGYA